MLCYSIKQFESFTPNPLSQEVLDIIETLSNSLIGSTNDRTSIPEHKKHYVVGNGHRTNGKSNHHIKPTSFLRQNEQLVASKVFKITAFEQKEGIEKTFNDIQILLNKLSNKNYRENITRIFEYIQTNNLYDKPEDIRKIADFIFAIVSQNAFFSELYSNLFIEFESQFSIFQTILMEKVEEYITSFQNFKYVEPTDNYEDYCAFNKSNDAKKAIAAFFIHLMNKGAFANTHILRIIEVLQGIIMTSIETETTTGVIDEIFEFLAIFMSASSKKTMYDDFPHLIENVKMISKIAPKERKSVSSRTIFKAIDLYDKLQTLV